MGRPGANANATGAGQQNSPTAYPPPPPPPTVPYPPPAGHDSDMQYPPMATAGIGEPAAAAVYPPEAVQYPPPSPPPQPQPVKYPPQSPVVSGTPVSYPPPPQMTPQHANHLGAPSPYLIGNLWSTGIFDCDRDINNAIVTAFFPCVTFGQIAEILDQGQTTCTLGSIMYGLLMPVLACFIMGSTYRQRLRNQYNLIQAPAEDWVLHLCCAWCALCQEYRELQARGIDPALGWIGNLARQQQMATTPPTMQTMNK